MKDSQIQMTSSELEELKKKGKLEEATKEKKKFRRKTKRI